MSSVSTWKGSNMRIRLYGGKYEFRTIEGDYRIECLRYDEPWLMFERGHNAIKALMIAAEDPALACEHGDKEPAPKDVQHYQIVVDKGPPTVAQWCPQCGSIRFINGNNVGEWNKPVRKTE